MKKLFIYYYDEIFKYYKHMTYERALEQDLLFYYNGSLFLRRSCFSNELEFVSQGFNSRKDPLFEIIKENKRSYAILEDLDNENNN